MPAREEVVADLPHHGSDRCGPLDLAGMNGPAAPPLQSPRVMTPWRHGSSVSDPVAVEELRINSNVSVACSFGIASRLAKGTEAAGAAFTGVGHLEEGRRSKGLGNWC